MKQTITKSSFIDAFHHADRGNTFTYEGLGALFDYLEEVDKDYDLDVIELCCGYSEYENIAEYNEAYASEFENVDALIENDKCFVIKIDNERFITSCH